MRIAMPSISMMCLSALLAPASGAAQADLNDPSLAVHATLPQNNRPGVPIQEGLANASKSAKARGLPDTGIVITTNDESRPLTDAQFQSFYQKYIVCHVDTVVVGRANNWAYHPSANGERIYADYDVQIGSVVMAKTPRPDKNIVVTRPGGTLTMEGKTASYDDDSFPRLDPQKKYLFLLRYVTASGGYESLGDWGTFEENGQDWRVSRNGQGKNTRSPVLAQGTFESQLVSWISQCPK
jgi:hypothetical protein